MFNPHPHSLVYHMRLVEMYISVTRFFYYSSIIVLILEVNIVYRLVTVNFHESSFFLNLLTNLLTLLSDLSFYKISEELTHT